MQSLRERVGLSVLSAAAMIIVATLISLFAVLLLEGGPALSLEFLLSPPRQGMTAGGILPAIVGTVFVTLVTALLAVPVGIGAAVYLSEYAPDTRTTRLIRASIRNLSGVPSIVYGLFGVALFVHGLNLGLSILSSGLTLGLLTLPYTISASEEALRAVPGGLREGALALGATRWEVVSRILLPAAGPGIITGAILGVARAGGETAPLLFTGVSFSKRNLPSSPLDDYMALPNHIYVLATQHHETELVRPLAYGSALVLVGVILALTLTAAWLRYRLTSRAR